MLHLPGAIGRMACAAVSPWIAALTLARARWISNSNCSRDVAAARRVANGGGTGGTVFRTAGLRAAGFRTAVFCTAVFRTAAFPAAGPAATRLRTPARGGGRSEEQ